MPKRKPFYVAEVLVALSLIFSAAVSALDSEEFQVPLSLTGIATSEIDATKELFKKAVAYSEDYQDLKLVSLSRVGQDKVLWLNGVHAYSTWHDGVAEDEDGNRYSFRIRTSSQPKRTFLDKKRAKEGVEVRFADWRRDFKLGSIVNDLKKPDLLIFNDKGTLISSAENSDQLK